MTQEHLERICERVYEYTRDQLSEFMGVPGEMDIDAINDAANEVQGKLQSELRVYVHPHRKAWADPSGRVCPICSRVPAECTGTLPERGKR